MTDITPVQETAVARPLKDLIPLIKADLEAANDAGMEYRIAAGAKMLEAKAQMKSYEFNRWAERQFRITARHAQELMRLAEKSGQGFTFTTMREAGRHSGTNPNYGAEAPYHKPVREELKDVDVRTLNIQKAALARQKEREAEKKLALQLINIGYKVLATKLHPDRGGSEVAMTRLNHVRDKLRKHV